MMKTAQNERSPKKRRIWPGRVSPRTTKGLPFPFRPGNSQRARSPQNGAAAGSPSGWPGLARPPPGSRHSLTPVPARRFSRSLQALPRTLGRVHQPATTRASVSGSSRRCTTRDQTRANGLQGVAQAGGPIAGPHVPARAQFTAASMTSRLPTSSTSRGASRSSAETVRRG